MKKDLTIIFGISLLFVFVISTNSNVITAQSNNNSVGNLSDSKINSGENQNLLKINYSSANKIEDINFQSAANDSIKAKRAESQLTQKPINMEEREFSIFSKDFLESAKDNIKRSESLGNIGDTVSIDPKKISGLTSVNSTVQNSTLASPIEKNKPVNKEAAQISTAKEITGWNGLDRKSANLGGGPFPPDVAMAVGPHHVVQIVHTAVQIWDKEGNITGFSFLKNFFNTKPGHFIGDQDIIYDKQAGRWFATIFDLGVRDPNTGNPSCKPGGCNVLAAVSANEDPTGSWSIYSFPFGFLIPDYPHIAVSNDKFVFTVNDFPIEGEGFLGTQIIVADKNSMINGQNLSFVMTNPDPKYFTLLPVRTGTSEECMYLSSTDTRTSNSLQPKFTSIHLFNICGNPSSNNVQIQHLKQIKMSPAPLPVLASQPTITKKIDTGDMRMLSAVYQNNTILQTFNTSCNPTQTVSQACIRVQKVNTSDSSLLEDFNIGINGHDVYHPSLAVNDAGNMILVSGISGPKTFLSFLVGNENNEFKVVVRGGAPLNDNPSDNEPNRFGDYLAAAADPIDGSLWGSGQYMNKNLPGPWSTYIGHVIE
jgi:hypothetical protein